MANFGVDEKDYTVKIIEIEVRATSKAQALEFALSDINAMQEEGTLDVEISEDGVLTAGREKSRHLFDTVSFEDLNENYDFNLHEGADLDAFIRKEEQEGHYHILYSTDKEELIKQVQSEEMELEKRFNLYQVSDNPSNLVFFAIS